MKSIRAKLWLGIMILVGIIIAILWMFQIVFLDKFYTVMEINGLKDSATEIASEIENSGDIYNFKNNDSIIAKIEKLINEKQLSVEILDKNSQMVYKAAYGSSSSMPGMMQDYILKVETGSLNGEITTQSFKHPKFGYELMITGIPVYGNSGVVGTMILIMPLASIDETVGILKMQLIIITLILVFVSLIISYWLSRKFAGPVSAISSLAERYAIGEYSARIDDNAEDEIGRLAKRMNEMGEALARNDLLQKELIANVSHELRTPLTLIRGYAETIRDVTGDNPEKRNRQLGVIIEESERLGIIVADILNLSQMQAGSIKPQKEIFSLTEILNIIKEHYELDESGRILNLTGMIEASCNVFADRIQIQQVIYNLTGNAFRHSKEGSAVEVAVTETEGKVHVEIRDNGEGISEEDLPHVFERYYKGKKADGTKSDGTGLGLAIVKSILEMHEAAYGVISRKGEGTTFWFDLKQD